MEKIKNKNNELKLSDSMNLIIKGNNQEEKTIYTTLQEDELSEEMHNLLSKSKIRKK